MGKVYKKPMRMSWRTINYLKRKKGVVDKPELLHVERYTVMEGMVSSFGLSAYKKKLFMECFEKGPKKIARKYGRNFFKLKEFYDNTMERVKRLYFNIVSTENIKASKLTKAEKARFMAISKGGLNNYLSAHSFYPVSLEKIYYKPLQKLIKQYLKPKKKGKRK